jgi:alkanesulfonate monooxygenase SsuD/methylene tetrahydromethanopterin reductase-like flavin-dependent oxidoreductase (luciferase family)
VAEQIQRFRSAWEAAGHSREPRVSVSRSIFPIVDDLDTPLFWQQRDNIDQVGWLDGGNARFGGTYAGEPDKLVAELAEDEASAAADTLLLAVPNLLGVEYDARSVRLLLIVGVVVSDYVCGAGQGFGVDLGEVGAQ